MLDFNIFAMNFHEYLYSLGFVSLSSDGISDYFLGKDYEEYFGIHHNHKHESVWYRESNTSRWEKLDDITPEDEQFLKQLAAKLVKIYKQNNIKKAMEEIEKDFV